MDKRPQLVSHPILGLVKVVDPPHWNDLGGIVVAKPCKDDAVPKSLFKLCGQWQLILDARLNPPWGGE